MSAPDTRWVAVGSVGRTHGVRGEVRVRLAPGTQVELIAGMPVRLTREGEALESTLESVRAGDSDSPIVQVAGIAVKEDAALWTLAAFELREEDLPEIDEDEFYYHEVIGARLVTADGAALGEVTNVWEGGGRHYLVCEVPGKGEAYLPLLGENLLEIRAREGVVVIDPAEMIYPDEVDE